MILGFTTKVNGHRTGFTCSILTGRKKHSFRRDPKKRWKVGMTMHMATGIRTVNYKCFSTRICTGIQEVTIHRTIMNTGSVKIDGRALPVSEVKQLAANDGFNSLQAFFDWFLPLDNTAAHLNIWEGRLLHWTDLKY